MVLTIIISSTLLLLFSFLFMREYRKHKSLKITIKNNLGEYISLQRKYDLKVGKYNLMDKRNKELTTMFLSEKALCTMNLKFGKHSFKVTYEVEIMEMTNETAKVKVLDVQTDDKKMKDIKYRNQLINYLDGDWVSISNMEFIIDSDAFKRDIRISKLLNEN